MSAPPVFAPRVLVAWIAGVALAFVCSLYLLAQGDETVAETAGANSFSRSALGYTGIAELLQRLGRTVVKSRYNSLAKLGPGDVLIIAEPRFGAPAQEAARMLREAKAALLILPKWQGEPGGDRKGWIADAEPLPPGLALFGLRLALDEGEIVRPDAQPIWHDNRLGPAPDLTSPPQLIRGSKLTPIVASDDGILLGELVEKGRRLWILSDPDVMANHGLVAKENAAFSVALINALARRNGSVIFDETVHGFLSTPASPLKLLADWRSPYAAVTLQMLLAAGLLLWAAAARFGAPIPAPPPLDPGKRGLIENAARLIAFAGYHRLIARRYVEATLRDVANQLHAPAGLSDEAQAEWLRRAGAARGVSIDCREIYRRASSLEGGRQTDLAPLVPLLRDTFRWKQEIVDGVGGDSRGRRRDSPRSPQGRHRPG